jgi:hypothetical protein
VIQYEALRMIHRHGHDWAEMVPKDLDEVANHDIERSLLRGARIFRCRSCDEEVAVQIGDSPLADGEAQ